MGVMMKGLLCAAFLISPFSFLICPAIAQGQMEFPYDGGMTKDSITVSNVKLQGFGKATGKNSLIVGDINEKASVKFKVSIPKGKVASLKYAVSLALNTL